jgi:hypothetical protein
MTPNALRGFAVAIAAKLSNRSEISGSEISADTDWQIDLNKLESVFINYENWFSSGQESRHLHSMEVVGSPLLSFLTFRTLADWEGNLMN